MQTIGRRNTYTPHRAPLAVGSVAEWLNSPKGVGTVLLGLKTLLISPKRPLPGDRGDTLC